MCKKTGDNLKIEALWQQKKGVISAKVMKNFLKYEWQIEKKDIWVILLFEQIKFWANRHNSYKEKQFL